MADTPRVTVPVEPTEAMMRAWHRSAWPQGPEVSPMSQAGLAFKRHYAAMLSASPAPEGGAVDDDAFKIATDLHTAFEKLIYGLPKYLEAENLTDEENMIRKAWITLDVTAHRLATLATREEAPAEAGVKAADLKEAFDLWAATTRAEDQTVWSAFYAGSHLPRRAQPQAREDAQPVAYDERKLKKGDQVWIRATVTDPCTSCCGVSVKSATGSEVHRYIAPADVRAHPAPDALRVAVEALELAAIRFDEIYEAAEVDDVAYRNEATIHGINGNADVAQSEVRQALAALQAEQKAGA